MTDGRRLNYESPHATSLRRQKFRRKLNSYIFQLKMKSWFDKPSFGVRSGCPKHT
jgi:hypothetical protein